MSQAPATLVEALRRRAVDGPDRPAFRTLVAGGSPAEDVWSWGRWREAAARVAGALAARRVARRERVAILAGNTPMWPVADLGIQWAGAISVGLYPTSAPVQVAEVLQDAGARVVFVDGAAQYDKVLEVLEALPGVGLLVRWDGVAEARAPARVVQRTWRDFLAEGEEAGESPGPDPDDDAVLIYTSGSTGVPKGARLTHRTLVASARSVQETLGLVEGDRTLSFLPYCHAAERIFGLATRIMVGMEAGMVPDATRVFEAAAAFRPTLFGGLPRLYEKIYAAALAPDLAVEPEGAAVVDRLLGGQVRVATSGGAVLPTEVATSLEALGLTVLGAYGLTEHLCATFNRAGRHAHDTAGHPMPGTELRIAEDGEILIHRSDLTFQGYLGRPEETARAFTPDGSWLRTGDLGSLDAAGRLRVTGRKKDLIALSTGKKVAPSRIEGALTQQPWIDQAVLVGEGRHFIAALLTLRRPVVERWARGAGMEMPWPALIRDAQVQQEIETQVDAVNTGLSRTESVRRFEVMEEPLTIESGLLTPTLKVRRDLLTQRFARRIDALYGKVPA